MDSLLKRVFRVALAGHFVVLNALVFVGGEAVLSTITAVLRPRADP